MRASQNAYQKYVEGYMNNQRKYGSMLSPMLDYDEYQWAYGDYYASRKEAGLDTKNINRLILNDQTFEYSLSHGRALREVAAEMGFDYTVSQLRQGAPEDFWKAYNELYQYHKDKGDWQKFALPGQSFSEFMAWYYWGSE